VVGPPFKNASGENGRWRGTLQEQFIIHVFPDAGLVLKGGEASTQPSPPLIVQGSRTAVMVGGGGEAPLTPPGVDIDRVAAMLSSDKGSSQGGGGGGVIKCRLTAVMVGVRAVRPPSPHLAWILTAWPPCSHQTKVRPRHGRRNYKDTNT
jgi:hypothetical protein